MPEFEERTVDDAITLRDTGHIEVRTATVVLRDGVEIARTYHRRVVAPGEDVDKDESTAVKTISALWTDRQIDEQRKRDAIAQAATPADVLAAEGTAK